MPIFRHIFVELLSGIEPLTCWLRISCSTNWATVAWVSVGVKIHLQTIKLWYKGMLTNALHYQLCYTSILEIRCINFFDILSLRVRCSTNWATPADGYLGVKYTYFLINFWDKGMLTNQLLYQLSHSSMGLGRCKNTPTNY